MSNVKNKKLFRISTLFSACGMSGWQEVSESAGDIEGKWSGLQESKFNVLLILNVI